MNLIKSAIAGAASAVGTHYADEAMHTTPHSPYVYYGAAIGGVAAAYYFRNRPIVAGLLFGLGVGSAYQGYTRTSASGGPSMMAIQNFLSAGAAIPRARIGGIPLSRPSQSTDKRALSPKIAPYGTVSFALAPSTASDPSWAGNKDRGVPLQAPWPYGLDADRFAKPPPKASSPSGPTIGGLGVKDIKGLVEQGTAVSKQIQELVGGSEPAAVPYSDPDGISDAEFYNE